MNDNNIYNVDDSVFQTIEMFDLQVDDQMVPSGMNPRGVGYNFTDSAKSLGP